MFSTVTLRGHSSVNPGRELASLVLSTGGGRGIREREPARRSASCQTSIPPRKRRRARESAPFSFGCFKNSSPRRQPRRSLLPVLLFEEHDLANVSEGHQGNRPQHLSFLEGAGEGLAHV